MTQRRTQLSGRQIERRLYLASRTFGDVNALRRGPDKLAIRLVRRSWRRRIGRASRGWL